VSALIDAPVEFGGCHRAFERLAGHTPQSVAIAFEGGDLTYAELNRRANRLAHELRSLGATGFVTVFRAADRIVTGTYGRTLGWRRLARGGLRVIGIPGDHVTMLKGDAVRDPAANLNVCIEAKAPENRMAR
jgi:thioesterase domain-containing protein